MTTPLRLELRASRWLAVSVIAVYGGGAVIAAVLPLHPLLAVLLTGGLLVIGSRSLRHYVLFRGAAITALTLTSAGRWLLHRGDGTTREARLLPGCHVHPLLTVLRFSGRFATATSVVLFPDSADGETLRRLRVQLKGQT